MQRDLSQKIKQQEQDKIDLDRKKIELTEKLAEV